MSEAMNQKEVSLQRIVRGDDELVLREPVVVSIDCKDGQWTAENTELGIVVVDEDYDECLVAFQEEFYFAWEEYGQANDSQLTVGAKSLKQALVGLVRGVEE